MMKAAFVIRINLVFITFFFIVYVALLLPPSSSIYYESAASLIRCSLRECHHKVDNGVKIMKPVLEETEGNITMSKGSMSKIEVPIFFNGTMGKGTMKIGLVNMEEKDLNEWDRLGKTIQIHFNHVSDNLKWDDLLPERIDELEENDIPTCPQIQMPDFRIYERMDMVVAKLPCKYPEEGWRREMFRLQVHLITANLAVRGGKRASNLASPLWGEQGIDQVYDLTKIQSTTNKPKREAYVTILHSSDSYVCSAITLAKSLLQTGTKRNLVLLLDNFISAPKRDALSAAGWKIYSIERIRNPNAKNGTYFEYNYSKFRLRQLTEYDKIVFIDADIIVLRNLDFLFHFPQMSATVDSDYLIEPSNCTFKFLMDHLDDTVDERLQRFRGLTKERKGNLEWALSKARELGLPDEHWKINITDPRREHLVA